MEDVEEENSDETMSDQIDGTEMIRIIEQKPIPFPLPAQEDPSVCRDAFLKTLLKPYERVRFRVLGTTSSVVEPEDVKISYSPRGTGEGLALMRMLKKYNRETAVTTDLPVFRPSLSPQEKQVLYKLCLFQFQKAAFEFLSVRLRKQIDTHLQIWPGELREVPHKLFHWSLDHFLDRFKANRLYLKLLTMERSKADLDCTKYCIDLTEIIRLLEGIRLDFSTGKDICESSMKLMQNCNYDVNSTWISSISEVRAIRDKLLHNVLSTGSVLMPNERTSQVVIENEEYDVLMPIEMRYRINWMHSNGEQQMMWLEGKQKVLQAELDDLREKIRQDSSAFYYVDSLYQYEIDKYKTSIVIWQQRLDTDLENVELECSVTHNACLKVKDDIKYHIEQIEMFKRRVTEVNALMELELEQQRSSKGRRSTKSPKHRSLSK